MDETEFGVKQDYIWMQLYIAKPIMNDGYIFRVMLLITSLARIIFGTVWEMPSSESNK